MGVLDAATRETADLQTVVDSGGGGGDSVSVGGDDIIGNKGPGLIARASAQEQKVRELATELKRERV